MTALLLGEHARQPNLMENVVVVLAVQFTWLAMGVMVNPFAGLAMIWVLVTVFMLDTQKGQVALAKAGRLVKALFGRVLWPILGLVLAVILAVLMNSINHNLWATISFFPIAQVLIFLGLRNWRISSTKSTNA